MLIGFGIFLGVLLPQTREYRYFEDDFQSFVQIREMPGQLLTPWISERSGRKHPFYLYLIFFERELFGARTLPPFAVLFTLHFVSAALVGAFSQKLGASEGQAAAAGLFFLCSSAFYQALIILSSVDSGMCFVFFMLAVLAWIDFLKTGSLSPLFKAGLFQTLAFFSAEDIVSFPLLAFFLAWRLTPSGKDPKPLLAKGMTVLLPLYTAAGIFIFRGFFLSSSAHSQWIDPGKAALFGPKIINLGKTALTSTFLPARGLLAGNTSADSCLRLLPAGILLGLLTFFFFGRKPGALRLEEDERRAFGTALGYSLITALPYMLHPLLFEHTTRYLYFPMAGFSFLFSIAAEKIFNRARQASAWRRFIFPFLFAGVLLLNLFNNAYHFRRYKNDALHPPDAHLLDYTERVKNLLSGV